MRATFMYRAGDVRIQAVPDPSSTSPATQSCDIVRSCTCGSDLHPYHSARANPEGTPMGHEFLVVEETGSDVTTLHAGDFVIAPFTWSDGTCDFCRGFWAAGGIGGAQAEAIRVHGRDLAACDAGGLSPTTG